MPQLCALLRFFPLVKKNSTLPSDSTAITASDESDMYTETLPMVQKPASRKQLMSNIGGYLEALPAHYADHPQNVIL